LEVMSSNPHDHVCAFARKKFSCVGLSEVRPFFSRVPGAFSSGCCEAGTNHAIR